MKYDSLQYNFNPLHVGNVWQYYFEEFDAYFSTKILQDSIINNKRYFMKLDWIHQFLKRQGIKCISWERNDTINGNTYMLDFEDIDSDGDTLEEFMIDSLVLESGIRYENHKYAYKGFNEEYIRTTYVYGTQWVEIWGDTVLLKQIETYPLFQQEDIADKFGIVGIITESPYRPLTGAIINGKQYGTIVSVEKKENFPYNFYLFQNYPNPFNPVTTIQYSVPVSPEGRGVSITLKIYNLLGQEVTTLVNEQQPAGNYEVKFDASNFSSGVYLVVLNTPTGFSVQKTTYLK